MADAAELKEAFEETRRKTRASEALRRDVRQMQAGTLLYLPGFEALDRPERPDAEGIRVVEDTTFHCAMAYAAAGERTAVLNFANAYSPGGGVLRGAMAQEECLCRSSILYEALTLPYLVRNYYKWNAKNTGDMGTDAVIYSPGVTVFRSDDPVPEDLESPFRTDVLTCAAPYINPERKKPVPREQLENVLRGRVRNILEVAAAHRPDVLVLGAFGCGVFGNPPELVAAVFREWLVRKGFSGAFRRVVFAIRGKEGPDPNLEAFRSVFEEDKA